MKTHYHERTFVALKPDSIQRSLVGEIISRFERRGLKIVAMKMVMATREQARKHYDMPKEDMIAMGNKAITAYQEKGIEINKTPIEIAKDIQNRLVDYLTTGPIIAMVLEGAHAVEVVRKIRGGTNPLTADVGTITADLTIDSYMISDDSGRAVRNLVHASSSLGEAKREIGVWFTDKEITDYDLAIEKILYDKHWEDTRKKLIKD